MSDCSKDYMTVSTQVNIGLTDSDSTSGTTNTHSATTHSTHSSSVQYDSSSSMDSGIQTTSLPYYYATFSTMHINVFL